MNINQMLVIIWIICAIHFLDFWLSIIEYIDQINDKLSWWAKEFSEKSVQPAGEQKRFFFVEDTSSKSTLSPVK